MRCVASQHACPPRKDHSRSNSRSGLREMSGSIPLPEKLPRAAIGRFRWRICAMLLASTTINYIDRQVLGVLAPFLQDRNRLERDRVRLHRHRVPGCLCDRPALRGRGDRPLRHAHRLRASRSVSGAWPRWAMRWHPASSALRWRDSRSAWAKRAIFRPRSRPWPNGFRGASGPLPPASSIPDPTSAPSSRRLAVPVVAAVWGWQAAFLFTGLLSAIWLIGWLLTYRPPEQQPRLSAAELAYIRSDPAQPAFVCPGRHLLAPPPDLGICSGQVHDRSDLVVLPVLVAEIPAQRVRPDAARARRRRWSRSSSWPMSAVSAAAGSPRASSSAAGA